MDLFTMASKMLIRICSKQQKESYQRLDLSAGPSHISIHNSELGDIGERTAVIVAVQCSPRKLIVH